MQFDAADIERLTANGTLQDIITHEMLHVLGVGTLWSDRRLLQSEGTSSVTYLGRGGAAAASIRVARRFALLEFLWRTTGSPAPPMRIGAKRHSNRSS
jgi:hypothetical protein